MMAGRKSSRVRFMALALSLCLLLLVAGRAPTSRPRIVGTCQAPPTREIPFPHTWQFGTGGVLVLTMGNGAAAETVTARYDLADAHTLIFRPLPGSPGGSSPGRRDHPGRRHTALDHAANRRPGAPDARAYRMSRDLDVRIISVVALSRHC